MLIDTLTGPFKPFPRWLSPATRDDAISDLYVAMLEGAVDTADITSEARRYASRAVAQFESRYGPRSLDEPIFEDSKTARIDRIECPSSFAAFDEIRFTREEIPCL